MQGGIVRATKYALKIANNLNTKILPSFKKKFKKDLIYNAKKHKQEINNSVINEVAVNGMVMAHKCK